ncbi:hypothetical protein MHU86_14097 [Fragilaria crotonensis]|nr:hypothetical protein MHU86_14097 [Fragilaria crotonensis]
MAPQSVTAEIKPSRSVMVRSLRRRLWKALQEEDVGTAMRAYTATKSDYDRWLDEELFHQERPRVGEGESKDQIQKSMLHPNDQFVRDDYYGPYDSYDVELLSPPKSDTKQETNMILKRTRPRLAGLMPWRSGHKFDLSPSAELFLQDGRENQGEREKPDETVTTLLHEACRLAHPEFVRLLLSQGGNPNDRNGQQRTALHMVTGGVLEYETKFLAASDVGIRRPHVVLNANDADNVDDGKIHKMAARAVNRLFLKSKEKDAAGMPPRSYPISSPQIVHWIHIHRNDLTRFSLFSPGLTLTIIPVLPEKDRQSIL